MSEVRRVCDIIVGDDRPDRGNILHLAGSISRVGLLHPIVLNGRGELIAGRRRLKAVKSLGWQEVPVTVVTSLDDALLALTAEWDENAFREPLSMEERLELGAKLETLERPKAKARQKAGGGGTGSGKLPEPVPQTRDKVAAALGISGKTYEKAKHVSEAAKQEPERFGDLLEIMETRGADPAHRELRKRTAPEGDGEINDGAADAVGGSTPRPTTTPVGSAGRGDHCETAVLGEADRDVGGSRASPEIERRGRPELGRDSSPGLTPLHDALDLIRGFCDTNDKALRLQAAVACLEAYLADPL